MRQFRSTASVALFLVSFCTVDNAISAADPGRSSSSTPERQTRARHGDEDEKHVGMQDSESKRVRSFPDRKLERSDRSNVAHHQSERMETEPLSEASTSRSEHELDKEMKDRDDSVTMHMTGFHCSVRHFSKEKGRVSFLGLIKLHSFTSLGIAMILSFGISFGLEYMAFRRRHQLPRQRSQQRTRYQQQHRVRTAQHAIISLLSHVAMLVAMTYSLEIMIALLAGHMTGHCLLNSSDMDKSSSSKQPSTPTSTGEDDGRERLRQSEQAQSAVSILQTFYRKCIQTIRDPFALLAFPAARERIRRQAHPKREGGRDRNDNVHEYDNSVENTELEESTTRDEEDLPLLRKRDLKR
jgi:Ctr copper transporter family